MKLIFLDIDGVLNCVNSKQYMPAPYNPEIKYVGIDEDKLLNLKHIVDATGAEIYLTSTWKKDWHKNNKELQDPFANEIDKRFAAVGLKVTDRTFDSFYSGRGSGINHVLITLEPEPEGWVVLDDEYFYDFKKYDISSHLVQTNWEGDGLTPQLADIAIQVLNNEIQMNFQHAVTEGHFGKE